MCNRPVPARESRDAITYCVNITIIVLYETVARNLHCFNIYFDFL